MDIDFKTLFDYHREVCPEEKYALKFRELNECLLLWWVWQIKILKGKMSMLASISVSRSPWSLRTCPTFFWLILLMNLLRVWLQFIIYFPIAHFFFAVPMCKIRHSFCSKRLKSIIFIYFLNECGWFKFSLGESGPSYFNGTLPLNQEFLRIINVYNAISNFINYLLSFLR